eukprot:CAMPEP_0181034592 /NCGR_PEP_ID=MMETSP1070-20121207/7892_1 /TAXON_ID=265543 /ORGANISM="Minutocellus polymorphus, Strain NH13" /LENGTH=453 /DNA_ID=CAMNT_0023112135 /DNA_START=61 /DNA_END=1422 /DNA_ORIENTATION=-
MPPFASGSPRRGGGGFSSFPSSSSSHPSSAVLLAAGGACCLVAAVSAFSLLGSNASSASSSSLTPGPASLSSCRSSICEGSNKMMQAAAGASSSGAGSAGPIVDSTYRHNAERYYETHGALPLPGTIHATLQLDDVDGDGNLKKSTKAKHTAGNAKNVLIIGDVHGCYDELMLLHEKAVKANGGVPFRAIISVGDLTAKGPKSVEVIRHFEQNSEKNGGRWYAVRGNNDDGTLKAVLKDAVRMHQAKYDFVNDLNDDDVVYMTELPYTITIPASILEQDAGEEEQSQVTDKEALYDLDVRDTIIVHAGFITGKPLEEQDIPTMIVIRGLQKKVSADGPWEFYSFSRAKVLGPDAVPKPAIGPTLWAKTWEGPQRVIFGHDAPIGLQRYDNDLALGIDTGAVYGGQLTGLILPRGELVQVDAIAEHENVGLWARLAAKKREKREKRILKAQQGQ